MAEEAKKKTETKRPVRKVFSNQGLTYCRPAFRKPRIGKTEGSHCSTCGYRKRGPNHEQGKHHEQKRKSF